MEDKEFPTHIYKQVPMAMGTLETSLMSRVAAGLEIRKTNVTKKHIKRKTIGNTSVR
jgi:hypothetical protein